MGLFDFMKNTGKKIFGNDEDAGEKIKEHIESDNPGVQNLKVEYKDGVASLSGTAETPEAMEKAVLMAGNVEGVAEVQADGLSAPAPTQSVEYYVIQKGDTLWALAQKYYGNGAEHQRIFEANREVIKDPNSIFVGQKIRIPLA